MVATEDNDTRVYGWVLFLMLISLYWGCEVNSNIGHTSFCGVAAVWYFSKNSDLSPSFPGTSVIRIQIGFRMVHCGLIVIHSIDLCGLKIY